MYNTEPLPIREQASKQVFRTSLINSIPEAQRGRETANQWKQGRLHRESKMILSSTIESNQQQTANENINVIQCFKKKKSEGLFTALSLLIL